MDRLQGALIGCGYFAQYHLHAWREVEGAEIAAVCDQDPSRAREAAERFGIRAAFSDAGEMLRARRFDFADIAAGPAAHRPLVELVARHKVPVICQKPVAMTLEDARAMVDACGAAGIPFMVHENFRWQRPMRALKERLAGLGKLFFARISLRSGFDVYSRQPYLATEPRFILLDLGVHLLDLARFFLGEAAWLSASVRRVNPKIRGEDSATALLGMESGAACVVDMSYASKLAEDHFPETLVHLEGENGSAALGPRFELTVAKDGRVERAAEAPRTFAWSHPPMAAIQESIVLTQSHWVECLKAGREPETSGRDNLKTLELVFGAYRAAETGQTCRLGA